MDWTDAEAALEETAASVFDTLDLRLLPRRAGASVNGPRIDDPDRTPFDFKGSIDLGPPFLPAGRGSSGDPSVRDRAVGYEAVLTAHDAAWPWQPVREDIVRNLATGEDWKIMNSDRDGSRRAVIHINRAG